jgi:hypothetical protein
MSTAEERGLVRIDYQGTCHRCGWAGAIGKVRRRDRKALKVDRRYRWLCQECTDDLLRMQESTESTPAVGAGRPKPARHRRVA